MKQASEAIAKNGTTMPEVKIEPLFNDAFVRIFGSSESANLTKGLINAILCKVGFDPIDVVDQIAGEHTSISGSVECKTPRLDVKIVSANRVFDLESQRYNDDIGRRSLFYGSKLLVESTERGTGYSAMPQVVVITLLDDKALLPDLSSYVHVAQPVWKDGDGYRDCTDGLTFILVELQKVRERYNSLSEDVLGDELLAWMYLLTTGFEHEREVDAIMKEFPTIEEFAELYGIALNDPKIKLAYEDALSAEREYDSRQRYYARLEREAAERGMEKGLAEGMAQGMEQGLAQGMEQGMAQGLAEGMAQGRKEAREETLEEIAERMRAAGLDEDLIRSITQ